MDRKLQPLRSSPNWPMETPRRRPLLADLPDEARTALNDAWSGLQATHLDAQILGSRYTEDTGGSELPIHLAPTQGPHLVL